MIAQGPDDPIGILIIASLVRDNFPWLYEIGVEAYRSAKTGGERETMKSLTMFRDAAELTMRGPFMEGMGLRSKEVHMMMHEIPMIIDHYIERRDKPIQKRSIRKRIKNEDESESS